MWTCGIDGCGREEADPEELLVHQARDHDHVHCAVCGTRVPDGYFAIRHALDEHGRAAYVRAYDADSDAIRRRENAMEAVEAAVDIDRAVGRIDGDPL